MSTILCIESDPVVGGSLQQVLRDMGLGSVLVQTLAEGLRAASREPFDVLLAEHRLADGSGMDLLTALRANGLEVPVIITSCYQNVQEATRCLELGAVDVLTKPLRSEAVRIAVSKAIELDRMRRVNDDYQRELTRLRGPRSIVGQSPALRAVMETVRNVAPTRATVLLEGESGTGKELIARALHELSPRADQPFVSVNCAALPEGLVESTLFGHERGAFTGATMRTPGAFERAHRGTLLLDEVTEMRLDLQAKLLRAIQEHEFERVGGHEPVRVDVRIVATTNRDLRAEVEAGRFRSDLYFRLHVVPIQVPPLRDRPEDIPALAEHFVAKVASELGVRAPRLTSSVIAALCHRRWTGNVRELGNAIERAVILSRGGELTTATLPEPDREIAPEIPSPRGKDQPIVPLADAYREWTLDLATLEARAIRLALAQTGGHRTRAARLLGITDRTLRNKLRAR